MDNRFKLLFTLPNMSLVCVVFVACLPHNDVFISVLAPSPDTNMDGKVNISDLDQFLCRFGPLELAMKKVELFDVQAFAFHLVLTDLFFFTL